MSPASGLAALLAFALLTVGLLRRRGGAGLSWIRPATLLLWAAVALRAVAADPLVWLPAAPALACTGLLHLEHVQGWKGLRALALAWTCWGLAASALALEALLRLR